MNPAKRKVRAKQKQREATIHRNANQRKHDLIIIGEGEDMPVEK